MTLESNEDGAVLRPASGVGMTVLPPAAHLCQTCAGDHPAEFPHNRQSLFYEVAFRIEHDRAPTWGDAMAHCTPEMQAQWTAGLAQRGVPADQLVIPDIERDEREMAVWVIYDHPADHPEKFVVRAQYVGPWPLGPGKLRYGPAQEADTLEAARALLPEGLHPLGRQETDDPAIAECWM